jgi:hypothetical protein
VAEQTFMTEGSLQRCGVIIHIEGIDRLPGSKLRLSVDSSSHV